MRGRILTASLVLLATALGAALGEHDPDADPADALAQIPSASRRLLYGNLLAFDKLPREERRALVDLDRYLAGLPAEERQRLETILHRYALWVQALPADRRSTLEQAAMTERIALVRGYLAESRPERDLQAGQVFAQSAVLSPIALFESSFLLRTWFQLTTEEKKEVDALKAIEPKVARLEALAAEKNVTRDYSPLREEFDVAKRPAANDLPRLKALKTGKPQSKNALLIRFAEARYLLHHEPAPLEADELLRFEAAMPAWFRDTLTPLAPDAARRRLSVLYRLVFPDGAIPPQAQPAAPENPAAAPRRAVPGGAGPSPF